VLVLLPQTKDLNDHPQSLHTLEIHALLVTVAGSSIPKKHKDNQVVRLTSKNLSFPTVIVIGSKRRGARCSPEPKTKEQDPSEESRNKRLRLRCWPG